MKKTTEEIINGKYQPKWCAYPDAWEGLTGCLMLVFHPEKISKKKCSKCEYYKGEK